MTRQARGNSRFGCILWLIAALIFGMIVWKAVPVRIQAAEFADYLEDQARFAARSTPEELRNRIMGRAEELRIPLDPKNLTVRKNAGRVWIECRYTIPLEFPFYTYEWHFEHIVDRPVFII
ncbi:MAG: hypothetical protein R3325_01320 [Thermoanaerobaculia bacterium]|nr:hypothetical protein [Thermoanaerobaculia bacterium]